MSLYEVFDVDKNASKKEIRESYKKLIRRYHPDKNKNTEQKFKEVQSAWEILSDDELRIKYDMMSIDSQKVFYDGLKYCFSEMAPDYVNTFNVLIKKYYGSEDDFKNDIDNFNIKKIYNKIIKNVSETIEDVIINQSYYHDNYDIPLYKSKFDNINSLDINYCINTNIKDKYNNKFKNMTIHRVSHNSCDNYMIPLREDKIIIPGKGENNLNESGNVNIKITYDNNPNYRLINDHDILITIDISLYQYIYGSQIFIVLPNDDKYKYCFSSCVDKVPIFCIKYMGMPYVQNYNYDTSLESDVVNRGDIFIHLKVDGINNDCDIKYYHTINNVIDCIFPPIE